MRTFTNFFSKSSTFQVANIVPGGVSSVIPVNLFNRPSSEQIKGLSSFYVPSSFGVTGFHAAFSYKYFLAKWSRYEYKKSYNKLFKTSGVFPSIVKPFSFFEGFVPTRRKVKFFHKRTNTTLFFRHQPVNGLKSFVKYKASGSAFLSYFDPTDKEFFLSLASSKKIRFALPRYKFFQRRRQGLKKSFFKKRFFTRSHRFYVLNLTRGRRLVSRRKKRFFSRSKKFKRILKFFRRSKKIMRKRRYWISGNFFKVFSDIKFVKMIKKSSRTRIARYFFRRRRLYRFNQYIRCVKKNIRVRRKVFKSVFQGSRKKVASLLLQQFSSLPKQRIITAKVCVSRKTKGTLPRFSAKLLNGYFRLFSYLNRFNRFPATNYTKSFFIRYFKLFKKMFYLSQYMSTKQLAVIKQIRQFYLFNFFNLSALSGFSKFSKLPAFKLPKKSVSAAKSKLHFYQRRQLIKLYRFSVYFNLLSRLMIFPRDESDYITLRLQFLNFVFNLTKCGKHFYLMPFLFNKDKYFGTFSLINSDLYARAIDEFCGPAMRALRPKIFKLSLTS